MEDIRFQIRNGEKLYQVIESCKKYPQVYEVCSGTSIEIIGPKRDLVLTKYSEAIIGAA